MTHLLLVAAGGAFGAALRHLVNLGALRLMGPAFPWGTFIVNIIGSLLMGLFIGWLARRSGGSSNELRLLVATGFLGGFTTFSAFSLDFVTLWRDGSGGVAIAYAILSVLLSIFALFSGLSLMRFLP
jgi:fluoride exporter